MSNFHLKIVSPDGVFFDSEAKQLSIRSIDGEIAILKGHIPFLTAVAVGECRVYLKDGEAPKIASCCGGMLNVSDEEVLLAVIESLGALGDKAAFDNLLYVTYLPYSETITTAARTALAGLKW